MKRLLGEFVTIVVGVLVALGVDEWRQDRAELEVAEEHLKDIAAELRQNLCVAERVRVRALGRKMDGLQTALDFLNDPHAPVPDPAALLTAFSNSTIAASPWLVDNQYQALQNSGNVRLVQKLEPSLRLAGLYEGPDVLFSQVDRVQGAYPVVVNELLPAQVHAAASPLRWYSPRTDAPVLRDDVDVRQAVERIRARREELLPLARNEAAVATGRWFALVRIKADIEGVLAQMSAWDRNPMPMPEFLKECAEATRFGGIPAAAPAPASPPVTAPRSP